MQTILIILTIGMVGLSLANFGCLIYVLYKMFKEKGIGHALLGFFCCQLYPFIWGWIHAGRLGITDIMIFWSFISLLAMVLQVVVRSMGGELPTPR
jgi:hypothetical protein